VTLTPPAQFYPRRQPPPTTRRGSPAHRPYITRRGSPAHRPHINRPNRPNRALSGGGLNHPGIQPTAPTRPIYPYNLCRRSANFGHRL